MGRVEDPDQKRRGNAVAMQCVEMKRKAAVACSTIVEEQMGDIIDLYG